jgi:hypothetical protein
MYLIKCLFAAMVFSMIACFTVTGQSTVKYDEEISRIVDKIKQYPGRTKDLDKLRENFDLANKTDNEHITSLLATGQPDIWLDVYKTYYSLNNRQLLVKRIPEKSVQQAGIVFVDYERELKESKYKATAYHYAHGEKLLQSENPEDARKAYYDFLKVANLDGSYKELDKMLRKAMLKGSTNVEFELQNKTGKNISSSMADQLSIIIWEFKRAKYGQVKPEKTDNSFTFILRVVLDEIQIGPDQYKDVQYQEERDVYSGNQVVDTIKCVVFETRQLKKAMLAGSLEYIDKQSGRIVNRVPVKVESVFKNSYATLQGDPDAAGEDSRELLKSKKAAYPSSDQMILDATEEFSKKAREIILSE